MKNKKYLVSHIGETHVGKYGDKIVIVDGSVNQGKVIIEFNNPKCRKELGYASVKKGTFSNDEYPKRYNRSMVGKKFTTNGGYEIKVVDGGSKPEMITVRFTEPFEYEKEVRANNAIAGTVGNSHAGPKRVVLTDEEEKIAIDIMTRFVLERYDLCELESYEIDMILEYYPKFKHEEMIELLNRASKSDLKMNRKRITNNVVVSEARMVS